MEIHYLFQVNIKWTQTSIDILTSLESTLNLIFSITNICWNILMALCLTVLYLHLHPHPAWISQYSPSSLGWSSPCISSTSAQRNLYSLPHCYLCSLKEPNPSEFCEQVKKLNIPLAKVSVLILNSKLHHFPWMSIILLLFSKGRNTDILSYECIYDIG